MPQIFQYREEPDTTKILDQTENHDVLMVNFDNDLFLSEVDEAKPTKSAPNKATTGSQPENGSKPAVDLFPPAPKKIKPIESTHGELCLNADFIRGNTKFYVRKNSNRERHPSSSREKRPSKSCDKNTSKPHEKRSSTSRDNRSAKNPKNQARREKSEPKLKSAIVKAKERMQQRSVPKGIVEIIAPSRQQNRTAIRPINRPPIQPPPTVTSGVFARLEQLRIPRKGEVIDAKKVEPIIAKVATKIDKKEQVEAVTKKKEFANSSTQTDRTGPCRCSARNQAKNKNRREQFELNRDLVNRFILADQ